MTEVKSIMLNRGQIFLRKLEESRHVIAKHAMPFITDGCVSCSWFMSEFLGLNQLSGLGSLGVALSISLINLSVSSSNFFYILAHLDTLAISGHIGNISLSRLSKQTLPCLRDSKFNWQRRWTDDGRVEKRKHWVYADSGRIDWIHNGDDWLRFRWRWRCYGVWRNNQSNWNIYNGFVCKGDEEALLRSHRKLQVLSLVSTEPTWSAKQLQIPEKQRSPRRLREDTSARRLHTSTQHHAHFHWPWHFDAFGSQRRAHQAVLKRHDYNTFFSLINS